MRIIMLLLNIMLVAEIGASEGANSRSPVDEATFSVFQSYFRRNGATSPALSDISVSDVATEPSAQSSTKSYVPDDENLVSRHASSAELDEEEFVSIPSEEPDSIDLSLSEIAEKAKRNKNLSSEELTELAYQLIKQQETLFEHRRTLSKQRTNTEKNITLSSVALETAQRNYRESISAQLRILRLDEEEKAIQEKIYTAMTLLYGKIMRSADISQVIKEQWAQARKPGKKLSTCETAYQSCLLL